ncbi:hypothetical protein DFH09DRAFT_1081161 [Mycena vulgaris]|nr:hypothetical protein DFH09DRAFT_1081161 [Mycena vulgaris]
MRGLIAQLHSYTPVIGTKHPGTVQLANCGTAELLNHTTAELLNNSNELQNRSTAHKKFITTYIQSTNEERVNRTTARLYSGRGETIHRGTVHVHTWRNAPWRK